MTRNLGRERLRTLELSTPCKDFVSLVGIGRKDMWRILAKGGYGDVQLSSGYDWELQRVVGPNEGVPPLDEIDPSLVGALDIQALHTAARTSGLVVLVALLSLLTDTAVAAPWAEELQKRSRTGGARNGRERVVRARYAEHIESLKRSGLVRTVAKRPAHLSGYFAVLKDAGKTRSIFNGKILSQRCPVPPAVNLPSITETVEQVLAHCRKQGRVEVVMGDFRHWFHQIPASSILRNLFGLCTASEFLEWQSLPMGWSWSPALAQACSWAVMTRTEKGQEPFFVETGLKDPFGQMPKVLQTRSGKGYATVYYDNFIMMTSDPNEAEEFARRLRKTCTSVHAVIKDGSFQRVTHQQALENGFEYLGVRFSFRGTRRTCEEVRWAPAKIKIWQEEKGPRTNTRTTCREAAKWVGRIIFSLLLEGRSLRATTNGRKILRLAREIGMVAWKGGWEAPWTISGDLQGIWEEILRLDKEPYSSFSHQAQEDLGSISWTLAVDASRAGYGWIACRRDGLTWRPDHEPELFAQVWNEEQVNRHIFNKELEASIRAILWFRQTHVGMSFRLVVDNAAVAWCITHGYTNNGVGMQRLDECPGVCEAPSQVTLVVSADNPADCPSRGGYQDLANRMENMSLAIRAEEAGWRWSSCKVNDWQQRNQEAIRHEGPRADEGCWPSDDEDPQE